MDNLQGLIQNLYPGYRVIKVDGWQNAQDYPVPRDCEVILLDSKQDYIYMKKVDVNGGKEFERYKITVDPIPVFDPNKYVTIEDFDNFKKELLDAINSQQQQQREPTTTGYKASSK